MPSFKFKIGVLNVVNPHVWVSAKRLNRIKSIHLLTYLEALRHFYSTHATDLFLVLFRML